MKRYPNKPNTVLPTLIEATEGLSDTFDISSELERCEEVLRREVRNLMTESARGKLSEKSARDLTNYIKLLQEMKHAQEKILKETPTEALQKLIKE